MKPIKPSKALTVLTVLIALLALVAAGAGVFDRGEGASYEVTSLRGERVTVYGRGLYRYEPTLLASQAIPQDVVTLVVCVPLLLTALWLYRRGSLRGQLLLTGTLAYFLYTYTSMAFGAAYNPLFLVYVALFTLSLYAFVIAMLSVDVPGLPARFGGRLPRRASATFLFFVGGFLLLAWLGRIGSALLTGAPPYGLVTNTTLPIQVMDLGLVVPLAMLTGVLLLRNRPLGYLLAAVALTKCATMGLALVAMIIGQLAAGVEVSVAEAVIFGGIAAAGLVMAALMLRSLREGTAAEPRVALG